MREHGAHVWICGAMVAVALIVVAATGNGVVLLPVLGCVAMMAMMMWMMMRMGGQNDRSPDARQEEK